MYEIIYMKADFEPWWMFEGWEEHIISKDKFKIREEAESHFDKLLSDFRKKYEHESCREPYFYAFWSNEEKCFCDYCDEDLQIFHGLLFLYNGKKLND